MFDLQYGLLMFFIGCSITIIGFFIAYMVAFKNYEDEIHKTKRKPGPLDDLMKNMPGVRYGDDCQ